MANGVASKGGGLAASPARRGRRWWFLGLIVAAAAGLFVFGRTVEIEQHLAAARDWIEDLGAWGPAAYVLIYVAATLLFLPGTPFTVFAALLFGPAWGFAVMMIATTVSAVTAFLIARYGAKSLVEAQLGSTDLFRRLKRLVEEDRRFVIPAIRFLPVFPYSFNNYALGLTGISFRSYLLWSELVFVIMNAVLVLGANALYRALVLGEQSWWLIGGATAAGLLVLLVGRLVKRNFTTPEA